MPELMAWADMAVTAGGITSWEIAFLGLPNLTLVLANNQGLVAEGLDQSGAAIKLGWYLKIGKEWIAGALKDLAFDSARRRKMAQTGQELVDGQGVQRVIDILAESEIVRGLQIRSASWEDVNLLWKWANDPSVRENSFHPEPIGRDEHVEWFKKKLADSGTRIWIIEMDGEPVAQIRYDRVNSGIAEIGFSVSLGYRGQEIGTKTLRMTSTRACEELNVQCLRGIVLRHNEASGRVFQKAGFRKEQKNKIIKGRECDVYLLKCESRGKSL
jgi:RimJ/RimL family protein N-acetyltransferase